MFSFTEPEILSKYFLLVFSFTLGRRMSSTYKQRHFEIFLLLVLVEKAKSLEVHIVLVEKEKSLEVYI